MNFIDENLKINFYKCILYWYVESSGIFYNSSYFQDMAPKFLSKNFNCHAKICKKA